MALEIMSQVTHLPTVWDLLLPLHRCQVEGAYNLSSVFLEETLGRPVHYNTNLLQLQLLCETCSFTHIHQWEVVMYTAGALRQWGVNKSKF